MGRILVDAGAAGSLASGLATDADVYTAPERLHRADDDSPDPAGDLYALGMVFYQIVAGSPPFDAAGKAEWRHAHLAIVPPPPSSAAPDLPPLIDAIILKLLRKDPAERYLGLAALLVDLEAAARALSDHGQFPWFEPGDVDMPFRPQHLEVLLQQSAQAEEIEAVIGQVGHSGRGALVLVSGPGGIGKTSLVQHGLRATGFEAASGKSDKLQRDKPYDAVIEALRVLFNRLLSSGPENVARARVALNRALDGHGRVITDLVAEAEHVLGPTPPLAEVPAHLALTRARNAICQTLEFFADRARPLVLFFDDLQWADALTLGVFATLMNRAPDHLCLIGAYRDGEELSGDLTDLIAMARTRQDRLAEIIVQPLSPEATARTIRAALPGHIPQFAALTDAIVRKASGNPFFINQLLRSLLDSRAISFDPLSKTWSWQTDAATGTATAGDLSAFMVAKLQGLPPASQRLLRHMACIGREVNMLLLAQLMDEPAARVRQEARALADLGLLALEDDTCTFVHDRVFEAAYALSSPAQKAREHTRVAALLLAQGAKRTDNLLFDIANHIEKADPEQVPLDQRLIFTRTLYDAASAVRRSGGIAQAKRYLAQAMLLTSQHWWDDHRDLIFQAHVAYTEALLADAQTSAAGNVIATLLRHARSGIEEAAVCRFQAHLLTLQSDYDAAQNVTLKGLQSLGVTIERNPSRDTLDRAYEQVKRTLGDKPIASLKDLPTMVDPQMESAMGLLSTLISSVFTTDGIRFLHLAKIVELSIIHGVTPESAYGLGWYGPMIAEMYGAYDDGLAYTVAAVELVTKHGFEAQHTSALLALDQVCIWKEPISHGLGHVQNAIKQADKSGDVGMVCYARNHLISDLLVMGAPLARICEDLTASIALTQKFGYRDIELLLRGQQYLASTMASVGDHVLPDLASYESVAVTTRFWVNLYIGVAAYWRGDFPGAEAHLHEAQGLAGYVLAHLDTAWCALFLALAIAANATDAADRQEALRKIAPLRDRFVGWAELNPLNFANKRLLIDAEIARLEGHDFKAMTLYEAASAAAAKAGFLHEEALAHERAGGHLFAAGIQSSARHHMDKARSLYDQWGASAKTSQLAQQFGLAASLPNRWVQTDDALDMALALKTSQALSEEILLDNLVLSLLRDMIVHAGADYGALITIRHDVPMIEAKGAVTDGRLALSRENSQNAGLVPETVMNTVIATRKPFLLGDARTDMQGLHSSKSGARSILCVPIVRRGDLKGIVYLENNQAGGIFAPARIAMIELLASQAAISLENARLYADLVQENERRARSEAALLTARAELARSSQLTTLGGLAASIAHEINQPLSAIASHADASRRWLVRPQPDLGNALKGVDSIRAGVDRVTKIIQALRSVARQAPQAFDAIPVDPIIRHVLHLTQAEAVVSEIQVTTVLDCADRLIMGDKTQLEQVMLNLITNAVDAMAQLPASRRKLEIGSHFDGQQITVTVRDNGPGIAPALRADLFAPLVTSKPTGMGMGLAICKSIIEAHGGMLRAESPATGAAFSFSIPVIGQ